MKMRILHFLSFTILACLFQFSFSSAKLISSKLNKKRPIISNGKYWLDTRGGDINPSATTNSNEGATIPNEIFNLVKSIVGSGVLGLPAGIAAFGNAPSALVPALSLTLIIGLLSGYCFILIGRVCAYTGAISYKDAWTKSVGPKTSWLPALLIVLLTGGSALGYSMILCDTIPQLFEAVGIAVTRLQALLGVTTLVLLPLCLLKELKSLAPFSLLGMAAVFYTMIAMAYRYVGGDYKIENGGKFLASLESQFQPSFGDRGALAALSPNIFILISMLSTATISHYLAHKFYRELRNNTIERFSTVVWVSFFVSIIIFAIVSLLGFLTFGGACSGLILNNYSAKDKIMSLSRAAIVISILTSFPLNFTGMREGVMDLAGIKEEKRSNSLFVFTSIALLSIITILASITRDLRFVFAFNGATWGNALIYLLPTFMFLQCAKKMPELRKEIHFARTTGILGLVMAVIGTVVAIGGR